MPYYIVKKQGDAFVKKLLNIFKKDLYPEVKKAGNLPNALDKALEARGSSLRVMRRDADYDFPVINTHMVNNNKFSQVYIAQDVRRFLPDFWRNGVCLAQGGTDDFNLLAEAIDYWLTYDVTTRQLAEKYPFIVPHEHAAAFDEGREVAYAWNRMLNTRGEHLKPIISLAMHDEVVGRLFPFTSHYTLCLSRCTGYPYDDIGLPYVTPAQFARFEDGRLIMGESEGEDGRYIVSRNRSEYLGEGNAAEALALIKLHLPPHIQPAVAGTADGLA
ncbi:DUF6193 family natural product biosynthesis protein [Flavobacterium akiainvivens]|nr:DUF6193 family natural product biosynthesis protein [Flavobacterium akiainvivens]